MVTLFSQTFPIGEESFTWPDPDRPGPAFIAIPGASGERRFRACVMKVAINVIHEESGERNVATELLLRATDSDRVEEAKGRAVRLRRREDAAWELELT